MLLVYQRVCIELMMRFVVWPWPWCCACVSGRLYTGAGGHSDNGQSYNNAFMQPHLILACLSLLQRYFHGRLLPQYSTHRHFATEAIALNSFHVVVQYCPYLSPTHSQIPQLILQVAFQNSGSWIRHQPVVVSEVRLRLDSGRVAEVEPGFWWRFPCISYIRAGSTVRMVVWHNGLPDVT